MEFEIKYLNGQVETVFSRPATDIAFERQFGLTVASLFTSIPQDLVVDGKVTDNIAAMRWFSEMKSEHSCFLAWHSSRSSETFDNWIETVDEVNWKFSKPVDPTRPARPATSSALSPPPPTFPLGNSQSVTTPTS